MPAIYGDNMVLQAEEELFFRGRGDPGAEIRIAVRGRGGESISAGRATVGADGLFRAELPPVPAGREVTVTVRSGSGESLSFGNVLTGEVWLCSGQSNMRWTVARSANAKEGIAEADHPGIRLFQTGPIPASTPARDVFGSWVVCSPETVPGFSAAGYYFGRDLHQALDRPVGLINSTWGGTPIQAWIPGPALAADPRTEGEIAAFRSYLDEPPDERARDRRGNWIYGDKFQKGPARLYNGMIHPLVPFPLRGVAWCQGEANSREGIWGGPSLYHTLFPMLIRSWREAWGQGEFPFLYVELANFMAPQRTPVGAEEEPNWAFIREAQASALRLPGVSAVSAIDIGEADDIHYRNKQAVGKRLALAALQEVYDRPAEGNLSPRYQGHRIVDGKVRIRVSSAEGGLVTDDGRPPAAFAIRGRAGEWRWAEARIEGDEIVVWHPEIPDPVAVRYAWASNPDVNVYDAGGLPLMPFRTDRDG